VAQLCPTLLQPHGLWPTRLLCPWDSPGKNTGVGCHFLLQGMFPTQGSNPGLLHCRQSLYCLSHQGSPVQASTLQKTESLGFLSLRNIHTSIQYDDPAVCLICGQWNYRTEFYILFMYFYIIFFYFFLFFFFLDWAIRHVRILVSWPGIYPAPHPPTFTPTALEVQSLTTDCLGSPIFFLLTFVVKHT